MLSNLLDLLHKIRKQQKYDKLMQELRDAQVRYYAEQQYKRAHEKAKEDIENWPHS